MDLRMLETLLIYTVALVTCFAAGAALLGLLWPGGRWLQFQALPLGVGVIVVVAHFAGFVLTAGPVAVILVVLVVAAFVVAAVLRRRLAPVQRTRWTPRPIDALVLLVGAAAGVVLLEPLLDLGAPTTIAAGNNDGWARAVFVEWLLDHPLSDSETVGYRTDPLGNYSSLPELLGAGLEYLGAIIATLTGRLGFETVMIASALAAPAGVAGWARLHEEIGEREVGIGPALLVAVAVASPALALPLADNYLTQFFSLGLWPFAVAASLAFFRRRDPRSCVVAAVGVAGVAGVYPPLLPWLVPAIVLVAFAVRRPGATAVRSRAVDGVRALVILALAVAVLAPIQTLRAVQSFLQLSGVQASSGFPDFTVGYDLTLLLGGISQFGTPPLAPAPATTVLASTLGLLLLAAAIAAVATVLMRRGSRGVLALLAVAVLGVTLVFWARYDLKGDGYGAFKALVSGGALLAGLLTLALAGPSRLPAAARYAAAGILLAVWLPVTATEIQQQRAGARGFREPEIAVGKAIEKLPAGSLLLAEAANETDHAFRLRMAAGYFAFAHDVPVEGIGSGWSYIAPRPVEYWRPDRPWTHVLNFEGQTPFDSQRRMVTASPPFKLTKAPALDVTPYGLSLELPEPNERLRRGWNPVPPGASTELIGGPVELVVSNRHPRAVEARLRIEISTVDRVRTLRLRAEGEEPVAKRIPVQPTRRTVTFPLRLSPESVKTVFVGPGPMSIKPGIPPEPVMVLVDARVRESRRARVG